MNISEYHEKMMSKYPESWLVASASDFVGVEWEPEQMQLLYEFLAYRGWLDIFDSLKLKKGE